MVSRFLVRSVALGFGSFFALPAHALPFSFSTNAPDGLMASAARVASPGKLETETADDFVTTSPTTITGGSFTGLLPLGVPLTSINQIEIELYHVFPLESANPPSGAVPTRVNSPSDNNFAAADSLLGQINFSAKILNTSFTAANSVVNGIHPLPNVFTGGEGPVTGQEVEIDFTLGTPFQLGIDHVFFRPEVGLTGTSSDFLWLSAPKPILPPGTPFAPDLQSWIRNDGTNGIGPDWERIGTDISHQGPFNEAFSLNGVAVPEPASIALLSAGLLGLGSARRRRAG